MFTCTQIAVVVGAYAVVHATIVSIYRLTFHPYAKYPGPLLAKLTNLYAVYHAYQGDVHTDVERCHQKYGKFVRYRPNALLVNSVEGFHDIYDSGKNVKKAEVYKVFGPTNVLGIQDKSKHAKLRKIMQRAFSDSMNREHEPTITRTIATFIEKLAENETPTESKSGWTNVKNMSFWCNWLTIDVVTKTIFTVSWNLLTSAANRGVVECLKTATHALGVLHAWPFLPGHELTAMVCMPRMASSVLDLDKYADAVIASSKEARVTDPSIKDVFGMFSAAIDPDTGRPLSDETVQQNSATLIMAGSDTTASSIAATLFYLARNATAYAQVAAEVRAAFPSAASICNGPALHNCLHLRAAVAESMRLLPVTPQPLMRAAEEGCVVDGERIPAGLNIASSIFSLQHNPEAFRDPYKWDMTRWLVDPSKDEAEEKERIKDIRRSFAPFSVGPRQCIAKNFALMELYLTIATVLWKLEFESAGTLGEGEQGEFLMKSYLTACTEGPLLRFRRRVGVEW